MKPVYLDQWWWAAAALLVVMMLPTAIAYWWDPREIDGTSVWAKPLKFEASLALHFATLAFAASLLPPVWRGSWMLKALVVVALTCLAFEITYIIGQAARQQASHFNVGTPFHRVMYALMGIGAVLLVVPALLIGTLLLNVASPNPPSLLPLGFGLGLIGGGILTLIVAGQIGSRMSPLVNVTDPALRWPVVGWSKSGGDLRIAHFFATHMMQAVPLFAAVATSARLAAPVVWLFALLWGISTIVLFIWALKGRPL